MHVFLSNFFRFSLFVFSLFFSMFGIFSFSVCNVDISEPWFLVNDSYGYDVLIVDGQGDLYFEGRDHSQNNLNSQESFVIGSQFFNAVTSKTGPVTEQAGSLVGGHAGLVVKNGLGVEVAKFTSTSVLTKGKGVFDGSQAGCSPDGVYCQGTAVEQTRNYFCDLTGSKVGACTFSVTASRNCNVLDYYFCSGLTRYKKLHTCSDAQGGCYPSSNLVVETCVSPADTYGVWSCTGVSTRSRVNVLRTPTCSPGGCGVSSSTVTETQNCGAGNYCQGGNCYSYTYSWNVGSWGSCSAVCGGIQTRSVSCQRNDGVIVADSFCSGVKPATSQSCGASSCNSFHWDAGSWGSCSVSCGGGIQSRSVGCYDSSNSLVSDSYCSGSKPSTSQSCNTQACTGNCVSHPHWEYKCYGGSSIWWYDSCGIRESVKESCPDGCQEGYIQCDYVAAYTKSHEQFWACQSCGGWAPDPGISDCINPDVDSTYNCGSGYTAIGVGYGHANYPQISGITEGPDGECSSNPPEPGINYISYKWLCRSNY